MTRALILGGGMVGSAMASDLAGEDGWAVTVADRDPARLDALAGRLGVETHAADLSDGAAVTALCAEYDIVLGALSSHLGFATLRAVIESGRNYVDISFMGEDAGELDELARARGVTAVVDCGVGPGTSNMIAGWAAANLAPCRKLEIYVGGLPVERRWPFQYKVAFAPADVIEEYVRPARFVVGGKPVVREALSDPELLDFDGVGTLEAFNTDGLRSLARTLDVPDMIEKTLRYPGHIELMRVLRHMGLFDETPIEVDGQAVVPRDVAAKLLFPAWTYEDGEVDLTVMRVIATGEDGGRPVRRIWELFDRADPTTGLSSMSRTTGFPATIMARMVVAGRFVAPGVQPPEVAGARPGLLDEMLAQLKARGVVFTSRTEPVH